MFFIILIKIILDEDDSSEKNDDELDIENQNLAEDRADDEDDESDDNEDEGKIANKYFPCHTFELLNRIFHKLLRINFNEIFK